MYHLEAADRLIQDRRPQNATETRLSWSSLPSGEQLGHVFLMEDEEFYADIDDLKAVFYEALRPKGLAHRNLAGRPVGRQRLPGPRRHRG